MFSVLNSSILVLKFSSAEKVELKKKLIYKTLLYNPRHQLYTSEKSDGMEEGCDGDHDYC